MSGISKQCKTCERQFVSTMDFLSRTTRWRADTSGNYWFNCSCGSTLVVLQKNIELDALKKKEPNLFRKLEGIEYIPPLSNDVMELQAKLDDPEFEMTDVILLVKKDPFLLTEVLKAAAVLQGEDINDPGSAKIVDAVIHIGSKRLKELAIVAGLKANLKPNTAIFDHEHFWKHAYLTAKCSVLVAQKAKLGMDDEAYLAGLFSNFGKIISVLNQEAQYVNFVEIQKNPKNKLTWLELENQAGVATHTSIGEVAGAVWGLPVYCIEAMAGHHNKKDHLGPKAFQTVVNCVRIANQLAHWVELNPIEVNEAYIEGCAKDLGLSFKEIEGIVSSLQT